MDQLVESRGRHRRHRRSPRRFVAQDRAHDPRRRIGGKRLEAGHHLEQDRAKGEDVGAGIDLLAFQLLGRHVVQGAQHGAKGGERRAIVAGHGGAVRRHGGAVRRAAPDVARQAKIKQPRAGPGQHDVARLQVPVHDAGAMRRGECLGNLHAELERLLDRQGAALQPLRQALAFQELHHQEQPGRAAAVGRQLAHVVERADVGMLETRDAARLPFEAIAPGGVRGHFGRQHLDGHGAIETRVGGAIDLAHAALANQAENLVRAKPGAGREHWCLGRRAGRRGLPASAREQQTAGDVSVVDHFLDGSKRYTR